MREVVGSSPAFSTRPAIESDCCTRCPAVGPQERRPLAGRVRSPSLLAAAAAARRVRTVAAGLVVVNATSAARTAETARTWAASRWAPGAGKRRQPRARTQRPPLRDRAAVVARRAGHMYPVARRDARQRPRPQVPACSAAPHSWARQHRRVLSRSAPQPSGSGTQLARDCVPNLAPPPGPHRLAAQDPALSRR